MRSKKNKIYDIIVRYLIIIIVALPNLLAFYIVFTPLTIYPVYILIKTFFQANLIDNLILMENHVIEIIPACIAGAAYFLLFILNMSIPNQKIKKRLSMIAFAFAFFLLINILRIFFLVFILDSNLFNVVHWVFWNLLSTVFVIVIWFTEVKIFKIKEIPVYSDLKFLFKLSLIKK